MLIPGLEISTSKETTVSLIYRGVTYYVSKQQPDDSKHAIEKIATLMGHKLIYRGSRYKLTSIYPAIERTPGLQLIYRGAVYQI